VTEQHLGLAAATGGTNQQTLRKSIPSPEFGDGGSETSGDFDQLTAMLARNFIELWRCGKFKT
jgi:hypothetical protein